MIDHESGDGLGFGGAKAKIAGKIIGQGIKTTLKEGGVAAPLVGTITSTSAANEAVAASTTDAVTKAASDEGLLEIVGDVLQGIWEAFIG